MNVATRGAFLSLTLPIAIALVEKMASNQRWNEERVQTRKRGGGMHQLKEVDMLSAKMVFTPKFGKKNVGTRSFQDYVNQGIDCIKIDIS